MCDSKTGDILGIVLFLTIGRSVVAQESSDLLGLSLTDLG
jgi:hypothetical protein